MNIPQESYQHVYAKDQMIAEESIRRNEAVMRTLSDQDRRIEAVELENHKLRFVLIVFEYVRSIYAPHHYMMKGAGNI